MRHKHLLFRLCCAVLLLCIVITCIGTAAVIPSAAVVPSQTGERILEGGRRDLLWPVPGCYNMSGCFLDQRSNYALDIAAEMGDTVIASYAGTVTAVNTGCVHNYGKEYNCCNAWGNYILLKHSYILKNGQELTLYSRYSHLTDVLVSVGEYVAAGQMIGTVGSTGQCSDSYLNYELLYGGEDFSQCYSIDPYANELLELPADLYSTDDACCQEYVAYARQTYARCTHEQYDAHGNCVACGEAYDWKSTRKTDVMGYYTVVENTMAEPSPYFEYAGLVLSQGKIVSVTARVVNVQMETWYEVVVVDGVVGYVPEYTLSFLTHFQSDIEGTLSTLYEGQVLPRRSHRLEGRITSVYPLRSVVGYLDGEEYASVSFTGNVYQTDLGSTSLNRYLYFGYMSPGEHTLVITATDNTGRDPVRVVECTFYIVSNTVDDSNQDSVGDPSQDPVGDPSQDPVGDPSQDPVGDPSQDPTDDPNQDPVDSPIGEPNVDPTFVVITYVIGSETQVVILEQGQPLGTLPELDTTQNNKQFLGWFTAEANSEPVTAETVPVEDISLYPRWKGDLCTVTFDGEPLELPRDTSIGAFPEVTKEGYRFIGWFLEDGRQVTVDTVVSDNMDLYSQWEGMQYTLTLNAQGGTVSLSQITVTYGDFYGELPEPVREGYQFMGWQLNGRAITDKLRVSTLGDHTVVAVWQKEESPLFWAIPVVFLLVCAVGAGIAFWRYRQREMERIWS